MKIFVSAYACEPGLGSEIGVGWHWILEMSKYFELWVLTRKSNQHTIEPWLAEHPEFNHIHFLYFDLPKWARFWKKGLRGVRTYYNIWQYCTNSIVKRTMQENEIKVFHHITYGNVLWKVSSYGQKQFFIWGPVGGLETIPKDFSSRYSFKEGLIESVRRTVVSLLPFNRSFHTRCKNADLILSKTDITRNLIPEHYRHKAVLFTDVAVENKECINLGKDNNSTITEYITVGRLDAWRGFDLVLESFADVVLTNPKVHLTIVGKGADRERLESIISNHNLQDFVTLTGKVSMEEYYKLMQKADVVVNASLKEGAVTVSFDSMAMGKPLICLDTTGYTRYFSNDYAILIPIVNRQQIVTELSKGMKKLTDSSTRTQMGQRALLAGNAFTWETKGRELFELLTKKINGSN